MENKTPNFLEKVKSFFKGLSKQQLIAIIAAVVVVAVLVPIIILIPKGGNEPEETTPQVTTSEETTKLTLPPELTLPEHVELKRSLDGYLASSGSLIS